MTKERNVTRIVQFENHLQHCTSAHYSSTCVQLLDLFHHNQPSWHDDCGLRTTTAKTWTLRYACTFQCNHKYSISMSTLYVPYAGHTYNEACGCLLEQLPVLQMQPHHRRCQSTSHAPYILVPRNLYSESSFDRFAPNPFGPAREAFTTSFPFFSFFCCATAFDSASSALFSNHSCTLR